MSGIAAGDLNRRIRIERAVRPAGLGNAGQEAWEPVATVWAQLQDLLPSRAEATNDGLVIATRRTRVRLRYRDDVSADMHVLLLRQSGGDWVVERRLQITAGPAELGRREGIEIMTEDYSTAGSGA